MGDHQPQSIRKKTLGYAIVIVVNLMLSANFVKTMPTMIQAKSAEIFSRAADVNDGSIVLMRMEAIW